MKISLKKPKAAIQIGADLKPGEVAEDGTVYIGFYASQDWYALPTDLKNESGRLCMFFNDAAQHVQDMKAHGHKDWMLPPSIQDEDSPDILREMFNLRSTGAFKGTYNEDEWYLSRTVSAADQEQVWHLNFANGLQSTFHRTQFTLVTRPVRAVPGRWVIKR